MKWDLDSSTCIKLHLDSNMQTWSEDLASGLCIFCLKHVDPVRISYTVMFMNAHMALVLPCGPANLRTL